MDINVDFADECLKLMDEIGLTEREVIETLNNRTRGMLDRGLNRLTATTWREDGRIVFVESTIKVKIWKNEFGLQIQRVLAQIALVLAPEMPGGKLHRQMEVPEILRLVSESFGVLLRCHPDAPYLKCFNGPAVPGIDLCDPPRESPVLVIGNFDPEAGFADFVWALDVADYLGWWKGLQGAK